MQTLKIFVLLMIVSAILSGRKVKFPTSHIIPGNTTFTITNFLSGCYKTTNDVDPIDFDLVIRIWYYDSNAGKTLFNEKKVVSNPGPIKQPVVITMSVPMNMHYDAEVNVVGKNCSRCASGWGGVSGSPQGQCNEVKTPGGNIVAIPRAKGGISVLAWSANETINGISRIPNKPESCGCIVPL